MGMILRRLIACFSLMAVVATAQAFAQARGAQVATGQMIICVGTTTLVVYVDAEGQPTEAPRLCPEGAVSIWSVVPPVPAQLVLLGAPREVHEPRPILRVRALGSHPYHSRGPPVLL